MIAVLVWLCLAQSTLPDDVLFVARARRHIGHAISTLPNYTCLETVDRAERKPPSRAFRRIDLVRMEVAKVGHRELFAWPGAKKFEERPIAELVDAGLIGNGAYSLFGDALFVNAVGFMKLHGREELDGQIAARIDYAVGSLQSGFTLTTPTGTATVGFSGSYWVDPDTLDLIRLDVNADDIPFYMQISKVEMTIEYSTIKIGGAQVLLPRGSLLNFVKTSGEINRNETEFARCREFAGESKLVFDREAPAAEEKHNPEGKTFELPGNLTIPLRLTAQIDVRTSTVGEAVVATADADIRDGRRIVIPKGSVLHGRIRRLDRHRDASEYVVVGLEFSDVEIGHDTGEFIAELKSVQSYGGIELGDDQQKVVRTRSEGPTSRLDTMTVYDLFIRAAPGVGYLLLTSAPFQVPAGYRMVWKTLAVREQSGLQPYQESRFAMVTR